MGIFHSKKHKFGSCWSKILIWINILYEIRACRLEKSLKINKRAGTFIPYSRVIISISKSVCQSIRLHKTGSNGLHPILLNSWNSSQFNPNTTPAIILNTTYLRTWVRNKRAGTFIHFQAFFQVACSYFVQYIHSYQYFWPRKTKKYAFKNEICPF